MAPRRSLMLLVGILVAACGTAQPSPSPAGTVPNATSDIATEAPPTPSNEPTVAPTSVAPSPAVTAGPFDGQPYTMDLPEGWVTFDLSDPAGAAALDAFVAANPDMAAAIEAFKALPNVTMAVNPLLGNVVVSLSVPTGGASLEVVTATMTSQFLAVPGIVGAPSPEQITLPAGPGVHWDLVIEANDPSGATYQVGESIYLVANDTTAVLVEFVEVGGAPIPQEDEIIRSLRFTP